MELTVCAQLFKLALRHCTAFPKSGQLVLVGNGRRRLRGGKLGDTVIVSHLGDGIATAHSRDGRALHAV